MKENQLTPGEALFVTRRRLGKTQGAMAKKHRVRTYQYIRWEDDVVPSDRDGQTLPIPKVKLKWRELTPGEQCVVMRRRSGKSRIVVARELGCSTTWLSAMEHERASTAKLMRFWGLVPHETTAEAA
jgi:hypothetical protein